MHCLHALARPRTLFTCANPHAAAPQQLRLRAARVAAQASGELPQNLRTIVGSFQMVPDPMARYKQLLYFASKLEGLDEGLKTEENKVKGCVSQVWMVPEFRDGQMFWRADSDAQLTKGLAALLVNGLSGAAPAEIVAVQPDFIEMLGLKQNLTPSRNNGFLNMFRLMQEQARAYGAAQVGEATASSQEPVRSSQEPTGGASAANDAGSSDADASVMSAIKRKLNEKLTVKALDVLDDSASHAGHAGVRGRAGGETHFRVRVVASEFEGLSAVKRHQLVYGALAQEMADSIHALQLDTKAPSEC